MAATKNDKGQPELVEELQPGMTGRWLVTTQGSRHIWDLDAMTYTRIPGPATRGGHMPHDTVAAPIESVGRWPRVGFTSLVVFRDPNPPNTLAPDHWRRSSTIVAIEKLEVSDEAGSSIP